MTRACGGCAKPVKKIGEPVLHGGVFLDQVVDCPACGWCGVETVILSEPPPMKMKQVSMFDLFIQPPAGGMTRKGE